MSQNTNQKVWERNGLTLPLDLEDADTMERHELAFERMAEEENSIPKDGKRSARLRAYCDLFRHLFDTLFGEGTAEKLFDGKQNAALCEEVYEDFLQFVHAQTAGAAQRRNAYLQKYAPNRAQKRAAKRK